MNKVNQDNAPATQNIVKNRRQLVLWIGALAVGAVLGTLGLHGLDALMTFVATVYTRLFQFLAVPTIVLAITTTLASIGTQKDTGRIFRHAVTYTLLTTIAAAAVGLILYLLIRPGNLPVQMVAGGQGAIPKTLGGETYYDHILAVVPNNLVQPFLEANVLSLLLVATAVGIALAKMPVSPRRDTVMNLLLGLQDILFMLIRALIWALVVADSLGRYIAVILGGNVLQFFVVLPLFLLARGINPVRHLGRMLPAVLMAFFTKSSAATLPVTMDTAEKRAGVAPKVSRFVLPICTTINMNGCAAFILVTSLFVMQNGGTHFTLPMMLLWLVIAVISAIGNAGVPMGCYFLTLSLMTGQGAPVGIMGIILPIYTIIDMVETAENVWSDSCVTAMTDKDLRRVTH